jgi:hypothetical protein
LVFIGSVLQIATAALSVIWTGRSDAAGMRIVNLDDMAEDGFFPALGYIDGYPFTGQSEAGKQSGAVFFMCKAVAAVDELGYGDYLILAVHG